MQNFGKNKIGQSADIPKAAILSPYLDILGGGEKYIFSIAEALRGKYEVYLFADKDVKTLSETPYRKPQIDFHSSPPRRQAGPSSMAGLSGTGVKEDAQRTFNISLKRTHFLPLNSFRRQNFLNKYIKTSSFRLFFYMTDGSLFFSAAKKNYLIIQSPLHIPKNTLLNRTKLMNWHIVCYSEFMESVIRQRLGETVRLSTLAPCINIKSSTDKQKKENIILSVGRLFPYPHDKKHDVLIEIFKENFKKYFSGWQLIIAGGLTQENGKNVYENLKKRSSDFPIKIFTNLSSSELTKLYQKSKLYWHAAGFGENLDKYPEKAEHFGIAPIEAMAFGTVPLVFNGGGLKDTITEGAGGFLWDNLNELIQKSEKLISNEEFLNKQSVKAKDEAKNYSFERFYEKLEKIIQE